jgi:hypothetical protein
LPDALRTEARTRSVARTGIVRSSKEGNVILDLASGQTRDVLQTAEGRDAREDRIRLELSAHLDRMIKKANIPGYHHRQEVGCTKDLGAVPQWEFGHRDDHGRRSSQRERRQQRDTS